MAAIWIVMNKITIELEIPLDADERTEEHLQRQTEFIVEFWRDVLAKYKTKGINVPGIFMKKAKGQVTDDKLDTGLKKLFYKALIDHHLKFMPRDDVGAQMRAIKALYATGKSAEELIALYNESRETYKMTTWHTVKFHLSKVAVEKEESVFERKQLGEEEKANVISRLKGA